MLLIDLRTFYKNVRPQSFFPISHCKSVAKLSSGNLHGIYVKENSKKAKLPHIQNEKCFYICHVPFLVQAQMILKISMS